MKSEVNSLQKCLDRIHLQCQGGAGCILTGRRLEYRLIVLGPLPEPSNWHICGSSIFEAPPFFFKKGSRNILWKIFWSPVLLLQLLQQVHELARSRSILESPNWPSNIRWLGRILRQGVFPKWPLVFPLGPKLRHTLFQELENRF